MSQSKNCKIIVFAGSGSSAPSGIPTFRAGVWNDHNVNQVCNIATFMRASTQERQLINRFYAEFTRFEQQTHPHHFHRWLKSKQDQGYELQVVTTNIDFLFERAGIYNVFHVHGTTEKQKCVGCGQTWKTNWETTQSQDYLIRCPKCHCRKIKPNVIFYGEKCVREYSEGNRILRQWCSGHPNNTILIDVGSSHIVYHYATNIIKKGICYKVLVNPDPKIEYHHHERYDGSDWKYITKCLDEKIQEMEMNNKVS